VLADRRSGTPDAEMVRTDDLKHVMALLATMSEREAVVLRLRLGLDGDEPDQRVHAGDGRGIPEVACGET
jgi:RNA polymerase primary sigma factor